MIYKKNTLKYNSLQMNHKSILQYHDNNSTCYRQLL